MILSKYVHSTSPTKCRSITSIETEEALAFSFLWQITCLCRLRHTLQVASYPAFTDEGKNTWFQPVCACTKFSQKSGKPCYFGILSHNGHLQTQWRRVLVSLGLTHNLHRRRIQWLEAIKKWPCGDCFTFSSLMLHDDVSIENNNYGCIIMQNNGAMKIVNFTYAQTAETRRSFLYPWTLGTRLTLQANQSAYRW